MDSVARQTSTEEDTGNAGASDFRLIDCDFHPVVSMDHILAQMSAAARENVREVGSGLTTSREHNRNLHPSGIMRLDATPPGGGVPASDPDYVISHHMDPNNVEAAIMLPTQANMVLTWAVESAVAEFLAALNDAMIEVWFKRDPRFKVLVSVSPHCAETGIREIERLADHPGVVGVNLALAEVTAGSHSLTKLYEAAAAHNLPVCIHPNGADGNLWTSPSHAGGVIRTYAEHHVALMQAGQASLSSLVLGGTFERVPNLKVVFVEFGFAWAPSLMWRMDKVWERNGGPSKLLPRKPSEYLVDQVRFTTQPFAEPGIPKDLFPILDAMQAERTLMFSSDYPHWDNDNPRTVLRSRLPAQMRERVGRSTALECFGAKIVH
ncbi:MAG: amidohydrolase family protein [Flavobacteriaceae bacterium]